MRRDLAAIGSDDYALITGGCGFIGTNLAHRLLADGRRVMLFDNLSRAGVERNLDWLRTPHRDRLIVRVGDVREAAALQRAVRHASEVFHSRRRSPSRRVSTIRSRISRSTRAER